MKNKIKKLFVLLGFVVAISLFIFDSTLILNKMIADDNVASIIEQKYIRLNDSYDSNESSIYDFFDSNNSLEIMDSTYNELSENDKLDYYVMDNQNLEIIGDYNQFFGEQIKFVVGHDVGCINQKIEKDVMITPLKAIQLDYKCMKEIKLDESVEAGNFFEEKICLNDNYMLPVIVGYDYHNIFKIGDCFKAYYLGEKIVTCKVIGILEKNYFAENLFVSIFDKLIEDKNFDKYIIMPNFTLELKNQEDNYFHNIIYCQRCEGYLLIDSKEDYENKINIIKKLSGNTGFKYNVVEPIHQQMGIDNCQLLWMMMCSVGVFFSMFIILIIIQMKEISKKNTCNYKMIFLENVNSTLNIIILVTVSYVLAYCINACIVLRNYSDQLNKAVLLCAIPIALCTSFYIVSIYALSRKYKMEI